MNYKYILTPVLIAALILLLAATATATPDTHTLHEINATHWYFETTQNDLPDGAHNYIVFANNISSDYRTVDVFTRLSVGLTAKAIGTEANSIVTTETCELASFGASTLTGGRDGTVTGEWADAPTASGLWGDVGGMIVIALFIGVVAIIIAYLGRE